MIRFPIGYFLAFWKGLPENRTLAPENNTFKKQPEVGERTSLLCPSIGV
jgi:hypothetical protein